MLLHSFKVLRDKIKGLLKKKDLFVDSKPVTQEPIVIYHQNQNAYYPTFENYPYTHGEMRSNFGENARLWGVRDVLIDRLRQIDGKMIEPASCLLIIHGAINEKTDHYMIYTSIAGEPLETLNMAIRYVANYNNRG